MPADPSRRIPRKSGEGAVHAAAAEVRRRAVASGVIVLVGALVVLFCCSRGDRPARTSLVPSSSANLRERFKPVSEIAPPRTALTASTTASTAGRIAPDAAASDGAGDSPVAGPAAPSASGAPLGAGARIANAVASADPRDLALLSRIERELRQPPSPAVHFILRRRREGAPRSELITLARGLPELPLRVLVIRWIDEVTPER